MSKKKKEESIAKKIKQKLLKTIKRKEKEEKKKNNAKNNINVDVQEIKVDVSKKVENYSLRRDRQKNDEEKRIKLLKTISKIDEKQKTPEYIEEKEFLNDLSKTYNQRKQEAMEKKIKIDTLYGYEDEDKKVQTAQEKFKSKYRIRVTGTSFKDMFESNEFKTMWERTQSDE